MKTLIKLCRLLLLRNAKYRPNLKSKGGQENEKNDTAEIIITLKKIRTYENKSI